MAEINASEAGTYKFDNHFVINRLGYGTMQLTGPGVWGPAADPENAVKVVKKAVELGVDFFDTADSYGPWFADDYLAQGLKDAANRDQIFISDKVGHTRQGPDKWTPHGEPGFLRQEVELSLFKFGIDHEDLLFLHRVDSHFSLAEQMTELKRMQDEGKIRHLGLSQVTVKQIQEAEKYAKIDAVENLYNLANRRDEDVLEYTAAHGIAFVPWFPLNTGRLAQAGGILDKIAKKYQAAPAQIALAWLLKRSPNILPIPGTKSIKHLTENVAAAQIKLSDEDFKKLSDASQF